MSIVVPSVIHLVLGNFVEPLLFGDSFKLSPGGIRMIDETRSGSWVVVLGGLIIFVWIQKLAAPTLRCVGGGGFFLAYCSLCPPRSSTHFNCGFLILFFSTSVVVLLSLGFWGTLWGLPGMVG